jgi:hypothetical protein
LALFGFVIVGALLSTLALTIKLRRVRPAFRLALTALLCLIGGQAIFWAFTFPANQATENWTVLPANWAELRMQWEYSHAVGAVLNLAAFIALAIALLEGAASIAESDRRVICRNDDSREHSMRGGTLDQQHFANLAQSRHSGRTVVSCLQWRTV